jgi:hypothetical protein
MEKLFEAVGLTFIQVHRSEFSHGENLAISSPTLRQSTTEFSYNYLSQTAQ